MITPQRAYVKAKKTEPNAVFVESCVDYLGTYAFPYMVKDQTNFLAGRYIFISKETGEQLSVPINFNIAEFNKAPQLAEQIKW